MARRIWSDRPLGVKLATLVGVGAASVDAADSTTAPVAKRGEPSLEIASVVKGITSIAEQTGGEHRRGGPLATTLQGSVARFRY
jgi:kynureninase